MTMTSGFSFMAFDTAMLPLLASPTISKSGMLPSNAASPVRTIA
jgi:hypothetical protein